MAKAKVLKKTHPISEREKYGMKQDEISKYEY